MKLHNFKDILKSLFAFSFASSLLILNVGNAIALTSNDLESIIKQHPYYDAGSSGACTSSANLVGSDNPKKVWNNLIGRGLTPVAVAALMGNFEAETAGTWDPRVNNGGELSDSPVSRFRAYGLVQWLDIQGDSGGRQTNLVNKAAKAGVIPGDLGIQLEYMWDELSGGYKSSVTDKINAPNATIEEATETVYNYYEGLLGSGQGSVASRTQAAINYKDKFGASTGGTRGTSSCSCTVNSGTGNGVGLDIAPIISKYSLQSVLVKQVGGQVIASHNSDQSPDRTASVLKLIIAHAFLETNPDLSKSWIITPQELYGPNNEVLAAGQSITLSDALNSTLNINSSNVRANVLIDAAGGLSAINSAAHSLGYNSTDIVAYYHDPPTSINKTAVSDLTKAMEAIYTSSGSGYLAAQTALHENYFNINPGPEAAKWGMNGNVTGNSGVFDINGNKVIITLYINKTGQQSAVKGATEDIIAAIKAGSSSNQTNGISGQCSDTSEIFNIIKEYAWSSPHTPGVEPTQAYLDATNKAKANGEFVGDSGGGYPGIDCGAFVTRVMLNSGADPGYNFGGKLSNGAGNTIAQQKYLDQAVSQGKYIKVNPITIQDLQPGDIAIRNGESAHSFIYVGSLGGFNGNIASSSFPTKAPAAATVAISYLKEFDWYRLK